MPINLSVSDGEFTPYLKYNAKAGRFYVRPQGAASDEEVDKPRLLFDMANVRTGWIYYAEGTGPEKVWDPTPQQMAPRPAGPRKFKRGFEVMVFGNDDIPHVGKLGLREFGSTAGNVIGSFLRMFAEYERGMVANPDKVPFYKCSRVIPVQGAYGTNYEPEFQLIGWVERAKCPAFDEAAKPGAGDNYDTSQHFGYQANPPNGTNGHGVNGDHGGYHQPSNGQPPQRDPRDLDDDIPF